MDLLGDYGDDDDSGAEEEVQQPSDNNANAASANQSGGLSNLLGLPAVDDEEAEKKDKKTAPNRAVNSTEPSPSPTLSSKGLLNSGSWIKDGREGTPTLKPRNAAIRIISKSNTPITNSPALAADVPSDASCPASPHITSDGGIIAGSSISSLPDVTLPAAPEGEVDPKIAQNVAKFAHLRTHKNATVNADLYDKKEFHNPGILEFLVTTYNIKETGSNYPKELFDPESYAKMRPSLFYDSLRRQVDNAESRRREEVKVGSAMGNLAPLAAASLGAGRPLVQHVTVPSSVPSASALPPPAGAAAGAGAGAAAEGGGRKREEEGDKPRKRSKWDQAVKPVAGGAALPAAASTGIAINDFKRLQQMGQ